jgi:DNA replication protein DnaC
MGPRRTPSCQCAHSFGSRLEICDDRYQRRSVILTSQMPLAHWHEQIGDPTFADSILDRLIHNAYRIDLNGESIRKKKRKPGQEDPQ